MRGRRRLVIFREAVEQNTFEARGELQHDEGGRKSRAPYEGQTVLTIAQHRPAGATLSLHDHRSTPGENVVTLDAVDPVSLMRVFVVVVR
jgi:hypothetical protein